MIVNDEHARRVAQPCHHATGTASHEVQFYDKEDHLYSVLADYFAPFLVDDEAWLTAIVLARPGTTRYLRDHLVRNGYSCDGTAHNGEGDGRATATHWRLLSAQCMGRTTEGYFW